MAVLVSNERFLSLTFNRWSVVALRDSEDPITLASATPSISDNKKKSKEVERNVLSATLSPSGKFYAVCFSKSLCLWNTGDWSLLSSRFLARTVSKVAFTPKTETLIVADKSGDVYSYSTSNENEDGKLLLGHISVVLDVLVTPDEKYIITSDRDEKIRISRYPNAYNIHSYCLGHEEFVSSLVLLSKEPSLLLSGSGDGTLRIWDYEKGIQKSCKKCKQNLALIDGSIPLPILQVCILEVSSFSTIVCTSLWGLNGILVYSIDQTSSTELDFKQFITTLAQPVTMTTFDRKVWLLFKDCTQFLSSFVWSDKGNFECRETNFFKKLSKFINLKEEIEECTRTIDSVDYLFKRKYDNVLDYLEKKKLRLEAEAKKPDS